MEYDTTADTGVVDESRVISPDTAVLEGLSPAEDPAKHDMWAQDAPAHSTYKKKSKPLDVNDGSNLAGPEGFFMFQSQIIALDKQLRKLCNKARQLGSSVGILSASSRLRERLGRVLFLFQDNAADLFPDKIQRHFAEVSAHRRLNRRHRQRHRTLENTDTTNLSRDNFSAELQLFSQDISNLLECFSQFPEFVDEIPDQSLGGELQRWAKMLDSFQGDLNSLAVQRYLHDSMVDIGDMVHTMATKFIPVFISIGIPTVRSSQEHTVSILINQSTVATFFSGVTATMLQFSLDGETRLDIAVNVFWFVSLVFSTSSAVNSLLGLTWMQAIFRSPDHRVPWWVRIWIKRSPLVLLVLSVACFFVGLVMFAYSSGQAKVVTVLTTVLSALCCFGLVILSAWFICEQWVYARFEGHKWLSDVLTDAKRKMMAQLCNLWAHIHPREVWQRGLSEVDRLFKQPGDMDDPEAPEENVKIGFRNVAEQPTTHVSFWLTIDKCALGDAEIARHRWREAIRQVRQSVRERSVSDSPPPPYSTKPPMHAKGNSVFQLNDMVRKRREEEVVPKLRRMGIAAEPLGKDVHAALVRSVKFSPDGKRFITTSYDKRSFVVEIGPKAAIISKHSFEHPKSKDLARQLKWSLDGDKVLLCHNRSMALLKVEDGRCLFTRRVDDPSIPGIRSIAWYEEQSCLSAEGNVIITLNLLGEQQIRSRVDNLLVRDIAVTKDHKWLFCVGKYDDEDSNKVKKERNAHQIVVYSMESHRVVQRAPVFHEMCDITLASDNRSALVSFENKAPPQLWQFYVGRASLRLFLRHTYMPRTPMTFAGLPSIFGGTQDELILRAGTAGDINIWDRETTAFLYKIQMPAHIGHLTALAWNRGSEEWMFATGTHDGKVYVWTIQDEKPATTPRSPTSSSFRRTTGGYMDTSNPPLSSVSARRASAGSRSMLLTGRPQTDSPVGMSPRRSDTVGTSGTGASYGERSGTYLSESDVEDGERSSADDEGETVEVSDVEEVGRRSSFWQRRTSA